MVRWKALRSCAVQGRPDKYVGSWKRGRDGVVESSSSIDDVEIVLMAIRFAEWGQKKSCGRSRQGREVDI